MHRTYLILLSASALLSASLAVAQPPAQMEAGISGPDAAAPGQGGARARGRFAAMDVDGDGKVTLREFVAFQDRAFDRIDTQHKGQIDKADVDAAIAQAQLRQAGGLTRGAGRSGGEGGGQRQLVQLSNRLAQGGAMTREMWEKRAARRFERLDVAHVGYLTPNDLRANPKESGSES